MQSGQVAKQEDTKRYRTLLPTSQSSGETPDEDSKATGAKRPRPPLTRVACDVCRARKTRCCGSRPVCEQCKIRGSECVYISKDKSETRFEALKRECEALRKSTHSLQAIVDRLRHEPEGVAQETLRQLRAESASAGVDYPLHSIDGTLSLGERFSDQLTTSMEMPIVQSVPSSVPSAMLAQDHRLYQPNPFFTRGHQLSVSAATTNSGRVSALDWPEHQPSSRELAFQASNPGQLGVYAQQLGFGGDEVGDGTDGTYSRDVTTSWFLPDSGQRLRRDGVN